MGVYHISQLLYLLNTPKVERVSGSIYQELDMHPGRREESGFDVEELGLGLVKFSGGLTMNIIESWAIHADTFPLSSIHGSKGGIQFVEPVREYGQLRHRLKYFSEIEGYPAETIHDVSAEDYRQFNVDPTREFYEDSQAHWIAVLRGLCEQIDTPHIALQTMLISEGVFLSSQLGREVMADEIESLSKSNAIQEQETPFGTLIYPKYPFL